VASIKKNSEPLKSSKKNAEQKKAAGKTTISLTDHHFPIVAIGASAGGLEAIKQLLQYLPADLGAAYVVIQHLSPTHESILPEILAKSTAMEVLQVKNTTRVLADHVYVIPPNCYMNIIDGSLTLSPRVKTDGSFHSIDFFLTALAPIYKNKAIAIILSGTATDGTLGIRAIKAEGGITFAQDETAKFQGMTQNAIDSGNIDFVLPPEGIAKELISLIQHPAISSDEVTTDENELRKIQAILLNNTGVDFFHYKQTTITRRIIRRMALNRLKRLQDYTKLLREKKGEVELLYRDLLINVTSFFREPSVYQALIKKIFPAVLKDKKANDRIRIWVPACSTGEEAYSIAICLFEYLGDRAISTPIQVFATDLSELAIGKARTGVYSKSILQSVSPQRLKKFFVKLDGSYQIIKPIRDVCVFATHNLLKDPPFSRMDLISCQNMLIYIEANTQKKIFQSFHYALQPSGYLLLGKSETIGNSTDLYEPADKEIKVYSKKAASYPHPDFSTRPNPPYHDRIDDEKILAARKIPEIDIEKEADKLLLSRYVPPSIVVSKDLQILRFHGATSRYLQPDSGKASLHLLKMVRNDLVFELRGLLHRAQKEAQVVSKEGITFHYDGTIHEIGIEVMPLRSPANEQYYLVLFKENNVSVNHTSQPVATYSGTSSAKDRRIKTLEGSLTEAKDHIKSMSEEFEATREELQSSNEEVLSSNEELQSINEELETSKEELQSANEELSTINEELLHRNSDLKTAVEYSEAILETISEPLIVLNSNMRIRTVNKAFYTIFGLGMHEAEAEGSNFFEVSDGLFNISELRRLLSEVLHKNKSFQHFEMAFSLHSGDRAFLFNATRMNDDNSDNNKILIVAEDITSRKKEEQQLKDSEERLRLLVQNAFDILIILSPEGTIKYQSASIERILGYKPESRAGTNIFIEQIVHPDDLEKKNAMIRACIKNPDKNIKSEFRLRHKDGSYRIMDAVCINLIDNPRIQGIVVNYRDITDRKVLENQKENFIAIASHELKTPVTSIKAYTEMLLEKLEEAGDKASVGLVSKLDKQVIRLTNLVTDLLDVTKLAEGQLSLHEESFDLAELISETAREMQVPASRHTLVTKLKPTGNVFADRQRIAQVLTNFISNAIKYSPAPGKIIISSSSDSGKATVTVEDFGIGVPVQSRNRVFDRLFRADDTDTPGISTFPGLGIGLYISAEIIKKHGGTIGIKSKRNKGAKFFFTLPYKNN
jgi:two-component system, chemotaxis family, CheB/CheR fusion protein